MLVKNALELISNLLIRNVGGILLVLTKVAQKLLHQWSFGLTCSLRGFVGRVFCWCHMLIGFCIGIMATKLNMQRPNLFTKLSHSTSKIANLFIALSVGGSSTRAG